MVVIKGLAVGHKKKSVRRTRLVLVLAAGDVFMLLTTSDPMKSSALPSDAQIGTWVNDYFVTMPWPTLTV